MLLFWKNVKDELEYNLITQKELSAKLGISYNTLQSWITKDRLPNVEQALKIAKELNASIEYLVTGKVENQETKNPHMQELLPKLKHLSDESLDLLGMLARKLK